MLRASLHPPQGKYSQVLAVASMPSTPSQSSAATLTTPSTTSSPGRAIPTRMSLMQQRLSSARSTCVRPLTPGAHVSPVGRPQTSVSIKRRSSGSPISSKSVKSTPLSCMRCVSVMTQTSSGRLLSSRRARGWSRTYFQAPSCSTLCMPLTTTPWRSYSGTQSPLTRSRPSTTSPPARRWPIDSPAMVVAVPSDSSTDVAGSKQKIIPMLAPIVIVKAKNSGNMKLNNILAAKAA